MIDLLSEKSVVGGGPANTAKALARLGHAVEFIGGISTDTFGEMARRELMEDGVGLRHVLISAKPTSTAKVMIDKSGTASYLFMIDGTATFDFGDWLPDPYRFKPALLHIGTLATVISPGAENLYRWAQNFSELAPIIFDPNIRPAVLSDHQKYLDIVEKWIGISAVVKLSDEDLLWLYPGQEPVETARRWIDCGVMLVIITKGERGIIAVNANEEISVEGVNVEVVDTVGAGDTVGAIIAEAVLERGLINLRGDILREVLSNAVLAAGITCSRVGANPPTRKELISALELRV